MNEFLQVTLKWVMIISFSSIIISILANWILGHFDSKKMLQSFVIVFLIAAGIGVCSIITNYYVPNENTVRAPESVCTLEFPYICSSWPVFSEPFAIATRGLLRAMDMTNIIPIGVISSLSAFMIYSKLVKGVWLGGKEICAAFLSGMILYISLANFYYFKDGIWNLFDHLIRGDGQTSLTEFTSKMNNWTGLLAATSYELEDAGLFSKISNGFFAWVLNAFQTGLLTTPLMFVGVVNMVLILFQQIFMIFVPLSIIKTLFTTENDAFVAIRAIFSYSIFCIGLHIELKILNWIPSAPSEINFGTFVSGTMELIAALCIIFICLLIMILYAILVFFQMIKPLIFK